MKRSYRHLAMLALLVSWGGARAIACESPEAKFPPAVVGAWKEESGRRLLNIEDSRMIELADGKLTVRGLISQHGDGLVLREAGFAQSWTATLSAGALRLEQDAKDKKSVGLFHRLDRVPAEVRLEPLALALPRQISPASIQTIQNEITSRFKAEQVLLKNPATPRDQIEKKFAESFEYLRGLLQDVGWIDAPRFNAKTSVYAVILAKHTHDLRLMMTVLPFAERDLKDSGDGQTYAVLYDALQLDLGRKQLYGTQIAEDEHGPYVLPMEETRAQVNERLTKMGLPDLDQYLHEISKAFYANKPVRVRQDG